jgi:hypothetical protein
VSHRRQDGSRVNGDDDRLTKVTGPGRWKSVRRPSGKRRQEEAAGLRSGIIEVDIANPGNMFSTGASGGGNLGSSLSHDNEAPYPEAVAERFVLSLVPPGGTVLDPFSGSGTTAAVAVEHGRHGIGLDLRMSQCRLGRRRVGTVTPLLFA